MISNFTSAGLYIVKDKVTHQTGEIMEACNDAAIIRTFGSMFRSGCHNPLIRDLEVFRIADVSMVEGDLFPDILNYESPRLIMSGADYYEEEKEVDQD